MRRFGWGEFAARNAMLVFNLPLGVRAEGLLAEGDSASAAAGIFQPMPYGAAQSMADFVRPRRLRSYWKSSFLRSLSDGATRSSDAGTSEKESTRRFVAPTGRPKISGLA